MIENKKTSILLVLKILEEYSDKDHYLTQQEIIDKIYERYGISLERKSIANSLSLLQDLDYDIDKGEKGGFALISRLFDFSEVTFLVDALFSSKSISGKRARALANSISSTLSKYQRKRYTYLNKSTDVNRTINEEVFWNIEIIDEAIAKNKWVEFQYMDYDQNGEESLRFNGYLYHASPCYLVNNFGKYYFLGKRSNYDTISVYRVDYMKNIKVFDSRERIDPMTIVDFKNYNSITEYINDHIYMFGGEVISAILELKNPHAIQYVKDWFGNNINIYTKDGKLMARVKCNKRAFFYWAMQYSEHIHVVSPEDVVQEIKAAGEKIVEEYK